MPGDIFINYRRSDSTPYAMCLRLALAREFGQQHVFMDTSSIDGGEYPPAIRRALQGADVVLVVIGPQWLKCADDFGRRRLDQKDDWVRDEIDTSLRRDKVHILPILVNGAKPPAREALPVELAGLCERQAKWLRDELLESDLTSLTDHLRAHFGVASRAKRETKYPPIPAFVPGKLSPDDLKRALQMLPDWVLEDSEIPGRPGMVRTELTRMFEFLTYADAMAFMQACWKHIDETDHHPRWENVWKTVTVWLTTWDAGHQISDRDFKLARYFDKVYAQFFGRK